MEVSWENIIQRQPCKDWWVEVFGVSRLTYLPWKGARSPIISSPSPWKVSASLRPFTIDLATLVESLQHSTTSCATSAIWHIVERNRRFDVVVGEEYIYAITSRLKLLLKIKYHWRRRTSKIPCACIFWPPASRAAVARFPSAPAAGETPATSFKTFPAWRERTLKRGMLGWVTLIGWAVGHTDRDRIYILLVSPKSTHHLHIDGLARGNQLATGHRSG